MKRLIFVALLLAAFTASVSAQFFTTKTAEKAGQKLRSGDRAGAMAILDEAIQKGRDLLEAHQMRGNLRSMSGDIDGAIADYTAALEINPSDAAMYERRALYRSFKRDSAGALKDYDAAIANGARTDQIYASRARVKIDIGDAAGAASDYETALSLNPNLATAYIGLAQMAEKSGDPEKAIRTLQDFLDAYEGKRDGKLPKVSPGEPTGDSTVIKRDGQEKDGSQAFLVGSGVVRTFKSGDGTKEDIDRQTANLNQKINVSLAYFTLGRLYAKKDQFDLALANYEKGLSISSDDPYGHKLRSEIRAKRGDLRGTIEDLAVVANSPRPAPDRNLDRGILLVLQGREADAQIEFDQYLRIFPEAGPTVKRRVEEARKLLEGQPQK